MDAATLGERCDPAFAQDRDDVRSTSDTSASAAEWPSIDPGHGCKAFLAGLGVEDALIAYSPPDQGPRRLFVFGMGWLRSYPEQIRRLIAVAESLWFPMAEHAVSVVDLGPGAPSLNNATAANDGVVGMWPSPLDPFCQAVVAQHVAEKGRLSLFLLRRKDRGQLGKGAAALLDTTLPLFFDAVTSACAARHIDQRAAMMRTMFDLMTWPTLMVDERSHPLMINRAALQLMNRKAGVMAASDGSIAGRSLRETRALRVAVASAVADRHGNDEMHAVRLGDGSDGWLLAMVIPARPCFDGEVTAAAMIVIYEPRSNGAPTAVLSALGLLPSEQRFLDMFLRSDSLGEAASHSNLSQETARTYIKRIRAKLGAHRQMDLARLIYRLIPPVSADVDGNRAQIA